MALTWSDKADRDLLLAIIIMHLTTIKPSGVDVVANVNWGPVEKKYKELGYPDATVSSISQRFTKVLLRPYKDEVKRRGSKGADSAEATPTKRKAEAAADETDTGDTAAEEPKTRTKRARNATKRAIQYAEDIKDEDDEDYENGA
ncbi:hypothetical protein MGN70_010833 [Eutypa lata]|uniref:Uncharacterized protein n=1 Tax=Eutypa lata (strain UCR-EL1) TaxID=1287681 RepID=M7SRF4_EUTLA|nr:hypothetical protein UCREL1_6204 [Eutypa lata UCREL1]KAI1246948.1 hypothetical protein MGN70_010833 [Eutypa lata]